MGTIASQITSLTIVYSTVYPDADQRKHQRSASMAFVRGIHRGPVNSPHKGPVTRKMFPFDDVIMNTLQRFLHYFERDDNCIQLMHLNMVMHISCKFFFRSSLVHGMARHRSSTKILAYLIQSCQMHPRGQASVKFKSNYKSFENVV